VKRGEGNTNSPELSLLNFLLLTYHHSHFFAATLNFTSFFRWLSGGHTLFYSWAVFGLDLLMLYKLFIAFSYANFPGKASKLVLNFTQDMPQSLFNSKDLPGSLGGHLY